MFYFINQFPEKHVFNYDICIIGSGIAAHAIASEFLKHNSKRLKIAILEASAYAQNKIHRFDSEVNEPILEQALYEGELEGWIKDNEPNYLTSSRQRSFGGTVNIWSGWCWPLTHMDITSRAVRPNFKWPIEYDELENYYIKAQKFLGLGEYEYEDPNYWIKNTKHIALKSMPLEDAFFSTRMLHFNPTCINDYYYTALRNSTYIDIYSNANVLQIDHTINNNCYTAKEILIKSIENKTAAKTYKFKADAIIIAAGAIESTRLLLLSNIDKYNNQIGKNFMEHPYLWNAARFTPSLIPEEIKNFYFNPRPILTNNRIGIMPTLVPKYDFMESFGIGNFRILLGGGPHIPGTINISWEQMPNSKNIITLSDNLPPDMFGQKRVKIQNSLSDIDKLTVKTALSITKDLLIDLKYAHNFEHPNVDEDPLMWPYPHKIVPGNHPMGTTRMSDDGDNGVVDANCRIHKFNNLYICSSSVFPTGGYANPTLTIVALALRLAHHLKIRL